MITLARGRWVAVFAAGAVLALGLLPIASWIPGGLGDPGFARRWLEWGYGAAICAGAAIVATILAPSISSRLSARAGSIVSRFANRVRGVPVQADLVSAMICLVAYLVVARTVLDGRPLLIDEIVQVLQARTYASGHLYTATDSARAFFSVLHVVDIDDRMYSQFPPGWPAMLAITSLLRAEWIAGPVCGAIAVFVFARLLRHIFPGEALIVPLGSLLFGLAPFSLFQFASHMSHGPVIMWLLIATLFLARATAENARRRVRDGAVAGLALGCAFAVRPLDAIAFIGPAAAWLGLRALRSRDARATAFAAAAGAFVPFVLVLWVNASTTGDPFQFGYTALWGPTHGLGFHAAPWGAPHTPQRGIELLSLYLTRLNVYLFETPFPSLLPALAAICFVPRLSSIERFLLTAVSIHAGLYFAYWHDGFYLGPRFVMPWVPLAMLLTIRFFRAITSPAFSLRVRAAAIGASVAALALAAGVALPARAMQYRSGLTSMRVDYAAEAARAGVSNAVVFVRESWGSQLVARMWELGASRAAVAGVYEKVDACVLDHAIEALEQGSVRGIDAERALAKLLVDSQRVRSSNVSPDTTERMLPGSVYDAQCSARVAADQAGYALYPPFLLDRESGNVYARDLQGRDSVLMKRFSERRFYRVSRDGVDGGAPLRWESVSLSSGSPQPGRR